MKKPKSIIPEFMTKNKDDTFMFLMPLRLKIDYEDYGNSMYKVAVKNLTKNEFFYTYLSPEIFFTKFHFHRPYKNGRQEKNYKSNLNISKKHIYIDPNKITNRDIKLGEMIEQNRIVELLGWKRKYLEFAENIPCLEIDCTYEKIIIPHYAIANYFYYRSTVMREAVLRCKLDDLYIIAFNDGTNASITIPKYVKTSEAPFICRFATLPYSTKTFEDIGRYINNFVKYLKEKKSICPKDMPIKAKIPVDESFTIKANTYQFRRGEKRIVYILEIIDDDSDIGFKKIQILRESKTSSIDFEELDNLPIVQKEVPGTTTEVLKTEGASKRKRHTTYRSRKNSCSSLSRVEIEERTVSSEDIAQSLKIYQEHMEDEVVDQSLTESSKNINKKIRKTRISSEYEKKEQEKKDYTHNFDEFSQYISFLSSQNSISNLEVQGNQKMIEVINPKTDKAYPRCSIGGRARQYITATFQYKNIYVGLLELENPSGNAASTWVISSKFPVDNSVFDKFIRHYVDEEMNIKDIKSLYKANDKLRFATKNHERSDILQDEDLARWMVGMLGKIIH